MRIQIFVGFVIGMQALSVSGFAGGHRNTLGKGMASSSAESASLETKSPKGNAPGSERDDASELSAAGSQGASNENGSRANDSANMKQKGQAVISIADMDLQKPAGLGAEMCFATATGGVITAAQLASGAFAGQVINMISSVTGISIACTVATQAETDDVANRSVNPKVPSVSFAQAIPGVKAFGCKPTVTTDIAAMGAMDPDYYYVPAGQDLANLVAGRTQFVPPLVLLTVGGAAGTQADAQENRQDSLENQQRQDFIAQNGRPDGTSRGIASHSRGIASRGRGALVAAAANRGGPATNPNEERCGSVVGGGGGGGGGGNGGGSAPGGAQVQGQRPPPGA